jgi:hypothetical protein
MNGLGLKKSSSQNIEVVSVLKYLCFVPEQMAETIPNEDIRYEIQHHLQNPNQTGRHNLNPE